MAKPPPSGPEGDSGPGSNNKSDRKSSVPKDSNDDSDADSRETKKQDD